MTPHLLKGLFFRSPFVTALLVIMFSVVAFTKEIGAFALVASAPVFVLITLQTNDRRVLCQLPCVDLEIGRTVALIAVILVPAYAWVVSTIRLFVSAHSWTDMGLGAVERLLAYPALGAACLILALILGLHSALGREFRSLLSILLISLPAPLMKVHLPLDLPLLWLGLLSLPMLFLVLLARPIFSALLRHVGRTLIARDSVKPVVVKVRWDMTAPRPPVVLLALGTAGMLLVVFAQQGGLAAGTATFFMLLCTLVASGGTSDAVLSRIRCYRALPMELNSIRRHLIGGPVLPAVLGGAMAELLLAGRPGYAPGSTAVGFLLILAPVWTVSLLRLRGCDPRFPGLVLGLSIVGCYFLFITIGWTRLVVFAAIWAIIALVLLYRQCADDRSARSMTLVPQEGR
jgi:hypothetical protein